MCRPVQNFEVLFEMVFQYEGTLPPILEKNFAFFLQGTNRNNVEKVPNLVLCFEIIAIGKFQPSAIVK